MYIYTYVFMRTNLIIILLKREIWVDKNYPTFLKKKKKNKQKIIVINSIDAEIWVFTKGL